MDRNDSRWEAWCDDGWPVPRGVMWKARRKPCGVQGVRGLDGPTVAVPNFWGEVRVLVDGDELVMIDRDRCTDADVEEAVAAIRGACLAST